MEYGGITPIGLPADWPVLVDEAVAQAGPVVIGSGIRGSKLLLDGAELAKLPDGNRAGPGPALMVDRGGVRWSSTTGPRSTRS
jgi:hypothetical protein